MYLAGLIQSIGNTQLAATPKIQLKHDIPNDLAVVVPKERLETVFKNLFDNSIQHGFDKGRLAGVISVYARTLNDGNVLIEYRNNGSKMTAAQAANIFTPKTVTKVSGDNFGHGMAQIKAIVQKMGGSIQCVPVIDFLGTDHPVSGKEAGYPVFRITLPTANKEQKMVQRILVADDNEQDRFSVRDILEHGGFSVTEATTVQESLNILREENYIGVVLDYDFKESRDGIWLSSTIKQHYPNITIVMVTGAAEMDKPDFKIKAQKNGVSEILSKSTYTEKQLLSCFGEAS